MALQGSSRSRHFNFRFQPDFSIIEVVLGAFAHMDACPLLITSIVAVKPEDQGTFFQDFLGLSGYLCSIGGFYSNTALLRTRNTQNHNEAQLEVDQHLSISTDFTGCTSTYFWSHFNRLRVDVSCAALPRSVIADPSLDAPPLSGSPRPARFSFWQ